MSVAADFLEWLSKNGGKGLMRDPKTGRMLPRPLIAERAAEGPNYGGNYSARGEGMVRPSDLAEGPGFGGTYTARGETLADQRAPSTALVPVRPAVEPPPNFTMVNPPSTAVAPRASTALVPVRPAVEPPPNLTMINPPGTAVALRAPTDVARILEEANAARDASRAATSRWGADALWGLQRAIGVTAPVAAVMYANDRGRPVGPAAPSAAPEASISSTSFANPSSLATSRTGPVFGMGPYRGMMPAEKDNPDIQAVTPKRDVRLPPPRPAELQPGLMDRIFNGGNYQSNGRLVNTPTDGAPINWGDNDRASDFVRADKQAQLEGGYARGGMPTAHEHALHKAMHIIHHLITRR
jgi:hypothetical protein